MSVHTNLLIIDSNIQEIDIVINSIPSNNEYLIVDASLHTEQTILDFINNKQYNAVAYMSHTQQPYEHKIFSDYTFNLTLESDKQRLADFWNNFNTPIVDYLGCFFYSNTDWINTFNFLENNTAKQFRSSSNNTGHLAVGGDWILESDNVNIKDLYFTDNIDTWFQTLGNTYTSINNGAWGNSNTWRATRRGAPLLPDVHYYPNDTVIIKHNVTADSLTMGASSIQINKGGSLVITNTLNIKSGRLWIETGGSLTGKNIYLNTSYTTYLYGDITTTYDLEIDGDYKGSPTINVGGNLLLGTKTKDIRFNNLNLTVNKNMTVQNASFQYNSGSVNVIGNFLLTGNGKVKIPSNSTLNIGGDLEIGVYGLVIEGYNPHTDVAGIGEGGKVIWGGNYISKGNWNKGLNNWPSDSAGYKSPFNLATGKTEPAGKQYQFNNRTSLDTAVSEWITDKGKATSKYGYINTWNVSKITDFSRLFSRKTQFNSDISKWDVSNGTNFREMFEGAVLFNKDISNWKVGNGTRFSYMFYNASAFDGDLSKWDVGSGTNFSHMFLNASKFNGNIKDWDVGNGTDFRYMFYNAYAFNGDLSKWDVSNGTRFSYMFKGASQFDQDITWFVPNGTDFTGMFQDATKMLEKGFSATPKINKNNRITRELVVATGCFTEEAIVKTDQGLIKIGEMTIENTIDSKKIKGISKIIYSQSHIVTVKKDAFGENKPLADIHVAPYHQFLINNKLEPILNFINKDTIFLRKYNNEFLYNIILEKEDIMQVNNMQVQTMDSKVLLAKIFDDSQSPKQRRKIIDSLNNYHEKLKLKPNKRHEDYRV